MDEKTSNPDSEQVQQIRQILEAWADTTRRGQLDLVLIHHDRDALIYDVLAPLKYEGTEAYRRSWDEWHPDTPEDGVFELQDLNITAGEEVAFAHGLIRCGGTAPDGKVFSDTVRATFCLSRDAGAWTIRHQHISKPIEL